MDYGYSSIEDIILTILAVLVILILIGTIYSIIRAIIQFVFSNGDGEKIKKARNGIRYTIIWMIITVLLLFFFPIIFQKIWSQDGRAYNASSILERAMYLGRKILRIGSSTAVEWNPWSIDNGSNSYSETGL